MTEEIKQLREQLREERSKAAQKSYEAYATVRFLDEQLLEVCSRFIPENHWQGAEHCDKSPIGRCIFPDSLQSPDTVYCIHCSEWADDRK